MCWPTFWYYVPSWTFWSFSWTWCLGPCRPWTLPTSRSLMDSCSITPPALLLKTGRGKRQEDPGTVAVCPSTLADSVGGSRWAPHQMAQPPSKPASPPFCAGWWVGGAGGWLDWPGFIGCIGFSGVIVGCPRLEWWRSKRCAALPVEITGRFKDWYWAAGVTWKHLLLVFHKVLAKLLLWIQQ